MRVDDTGEDSELTHVISEEIRRGGAITFARFMELALYHPQSGYYSKAPNIGVRGDFVTSPEVSSAFGRLLVSHLSEVDEILGRPTTFDNIEFGPGRGTLASDLLDEMAATNPDLYARLRYWLIDVSPGLVAVQRARLLPAHERVARWVASAHELPGPLVGAMIANEVVDAFPVHVLVNEQGALSEEYVHLSPSGELASTLGPLSTPLLAEFARRYDLQLQPGERIEVNLAQAGWLAQTARALEQGVALIVDYGATSPGRYSAARREGTLLAYCGGAVTDRLLARPGNQDLTALVDFTALREDAVAAGYEVIGYTRQANMLLGLGLGTSLTVESMSADVSSALANRRGIQALVSPDGLGRFHVLLLCRRIDPDKARRGLSALRFADIG